MVRHAPARAQPGCSRGAGHVHGDGRRSLDGATSTSWPPPHTPTRVVPPRRRTARDRRVPDADDAVTSTATTRATRPRRSAGSGMLHRWRASTTASSRRAPTCSCTRVTCSTTCSRSSAPCTPISSCRSSLDHTDFFVRAVRRAPQRTVDNVCDGLQRFRAVDIVRRGDGTLHGARPTVGHRVPVRAGHRVRVQVSSGAHPVYVRNLGTDEPVLTATTWKRRRAGRLPRLLGDPAARFTELNSDECPGRNPRAFVSQPAPGRVARPPRRRLADPAGSLPARSPRGRPERTRRILRP